MINIEEFALFLKETFGESLIYFDRFKEELFFFEIDCLKDPNKKISVEAAPDAIKLSLIDKAPSIDFSLHEHCFNSSAEAKDYLLEVQRIGMYIPYNS
jgi:hypothetical protein